MSKKSVFCIATSEAQAVQIATSLKTSGFPDGDISVLFPDNSGRRGFGHEAHTKAPEGAATGVGTGGVLGGGLGWMIGIGALAIPGVGPFVAAGPIMAAMAGAAFGAAAGGLTGGLVGLGIPEYEAKQYDGKLRAGNVLISVHADNGEEVTRAKAVFEREGGTDISSTGESTPPSPATDDAPRTRSTAL